MNQPNNKCIRCGLLESEWKGRWEKPLCKVGETTHDQHTLILTNNRCCENYNGTLDITNSCIFCKTFIGNTNNRIREEIQKDLDNGKFYSICSNETTFKDYVFSKIAELLKSQEHKLEELEKAFGGCKNCYGKGYSTVKTGASGRIGINGKRESWVIDNINPCSCDRGKQIKNLIKQSK